MRLTKKSNDNYVVDNYISLNEPWKSPINKLGQLEDIEEELGIDFITLFKAIENGIWYKKEYIEFIVPHRLVLDIDYLYEVDTGHSSKLINHFHFKDYGKTWALTREELENGSN